MDLQNVQMRIDDVIASFTSQVEQLRAEVEFNFEEILTEVKDLQEELDDLESVVQSVIKKCTTIQADGHSEIEETKIVLGRRIEYLEEKVENKPDADVTCNTCKCCCHDDVSKRSGKVVRDSSSIKE